MKHISKQSVLVALVFSGILVFLGCDNDDTSLNSKEFFVYINIDGQPVNTARTKLIHSNNTEGDSLVKFPVRSTREALVDINASFTVDNALVQKFNEENKTDYKVFRTENIIWEKNTVSLKKGEIISEDSICIKLIAREKLRDRAGYLLPVKLTNVVSDDRGVKISTNLNTVFVIVNIEIKNIDNSAVRTSLQGEQLDRTNWVVDALGTHKNNKPVYALDNKPGTYWLARNKPWYSVDFGSVETIKGLKIMPVYKPRTKFPTVQKFNVKTMNVLTSEDGENWIKQGTVAFPRINGLVDFPELLTIKFYSPVTTRYIRFEVLSSYHPMEYVGFSEIKVLK